MSLADFSCECHGCLNSKEYRLFFCKEKTRVSCWHDIVYRPIAEYTKSNVYTCVIEIPKDTSHKLEMYKNENLNPIRYDLTKCGELRSYPYPIRWNYGFIPQTWEDPSFINKDVEHLCGDDDPIDIVDISSVEHHTGDVIHAQVLGGFSMIDDGELDWKIIVIDCNDPVAPFINSDEDVKEYIGHTTANEIKEWFRNYKKHTETVPTRFGHDEQFVSIQTAIDAIESTHLQWKAKHGTNN